MSLIHSDITGKILKSYFDVYNILGHGFLEKVYENALKIKLNSLGFKVESQKQVLVYFMDEIVGEYFPDIIVDDMVIIEVKAIEALAPIHEAQLLNYLKATEMEVGLLLNFGNSKPEYIRRIST